MNEKDKTKQKDVLPEPIPEDQQEETTTDKERVKFLHDAVERENAEAPG